MHSIQWWAILIAYVLITTNLASLAVSIYLHRTLTHKSIVLGPSCHAFFRFIIWFITGMEPVEWKVVHLTHHQAPADSKDDVHSPHNEGMWRILLFGVWFYIKAAKKLHKEIAAERLLIGDVLGNPPQRYLGVVLNLFLNIFLWGVYPGIIVWLVQLLWIPFWAAGVINGLGHSAHERDERTKDMSKDILSDWPILHAILSVITAGEVNHHAHHVKPGSAQITMKPDEFDWSFTVARLLVKFRLAKIVRV